MFVVTLREAIEVISRLFQAGGRLLTVLFAVIVISTALFVPKYSPVWYAMKEFLETAIPICVLLFLLVLPLLIAIGIVKWIFGIGE